MSNNIKFNKFLPIGSVVLLENATKKVMITGYCSVSEENLKKIWDYCGCIFPEGIISTDFTILFDHNQIKEIYHMGMVEDEEEKLFQKQLNEAYEKISKIFKTKERIEKEKRKGVTSWV